MSRTRRESGIAGMLICWMLRTTCRGRHRETCACTSCTPTVEGCGCSCGECCNRLGIPPHPQTPCRNCFSRCGSPLLSRHSAETKKLAYSYIQFIYTYYQCICHFQHQTPTIFFNIFILLLCKELPGCGQMPSGKATIFYTLLH